MKNLKKVQEEEEMWEKNIRDVDARILYQLNRID